MLQVEGKIFLKIRSPHDERLLLEADRSDYKLKLNKGKLREAAARAVVLPKRASLALAPESDASLFTSLDPFEFIYGKYMFPDIDQPETVLQQGVYQVYEYD